VVGQVKCSCNLIFLIVIGSPSEPPSPPDPHAAASGRIEVPIPPPPSPPPAAVSNIARQSPSDAAAVVPPRSSSRPGGTILLREFVVAMVPAPARTTTVSWDWRRPWIAALDDDGSGRDGGLGPIYAHIGLDGPWPFDPSDASLIRSRWFLVLSYGMRAPGTAVPAWWSWPPPPSELVDRLVAADFASTTGCEWGDKTVDENRARTSVLAGDGGVLSAVTLSKASPVQSLFAHSCCSGGNPRMAIRIGR
jgi:hypothetical protein